jgi:hypothetical protein
MMSKKNPWSQISPGDKLNVLRATKPPSVPFYWGKDCEGSCLLIAELEGEHKAHFFKNKVTVSGIETSLEQLSDSQRLSIKLTKDIDLDIFEVLCGDLLKNITDISDPRIALSITMNHLKRWKSFMSGSSNKILSPLAVRGLFAELTYLLNSLEKDFNQKHVIEAWLGPLDSHQDFIFMNTAVEIKAISGKERNSIWISSLDQLQATVDNLYLKIYRLGTTVDQDQGMSLNDLVSAVEQKIESAEVLAQFLERLAATGYIPLDQYNEPKFLVLEEKTFQVDQGFPKLTKDTMPPGIEKATYEIDLSAIESFISENLIPLEL